MRTIEEARRYAREIIDHSYETAIGTDERAWGICKLDAIIIDNEGCNVS